MWENYVCCYYLTSQKSSFWLFQFS